MRSFSSFVNLVRALFPRSVPNTEARLLLNVGGSLLQEAPLDEARERDVLADGDTRGAGAAYQHARRALAPRSALPRDIHRNLPQRRSVRPFVNVTCRGDQPLCCIAVLFLLLSRVFLFVCTVDIVS